MIKNRVNNNSKKFISKANHMSSITLITIGSNEDISKEDVRARVLAVGVGLFFAFLVKSQIYRRQILSHRPMQHSFMVRKTSKKY